MMGVVGRGGRSGWLNQAGLSVEAQMVRTEPGEDGGRHGYVIARRPG